MSAVDSKDVKTLVAPPVAAPAPVSKVDQLINYARIYKSMGFVPIGDRGKVPVGKGWQNVTPEESVQLIETQARSGKINNIGIVTGKASGVVVIDIDSKDNGVANWFKLVEKNGSPVTFVVQTGTGYHYYFKYDEKTSRLHNGVIRGVGDFRTDGGQVVAPGSTHPDTGKIYIVVGGFDNATQKPIVATAPEWVFQLVATNQK